MQELGRNLGLCIQVCLIMKTVLLCHVDDARDFEPHKTCSLVIFQLFYSRNYLKKYYKISIVTMYCQ